MVTHWRWVTHICVRKLTIIGSDNGLSPGRRQAIIWTNCRILLFGPLGTNLSEIFIEIHSFSFKKMHLKMSSGKWLSFCLALNVLINLLTVCCIQITSSSQGHMKTLVGRFNTKTPSCIGSPITKIRRLWDRLIFITGIPILARCHPDTDSASRYLRFSWL